MFIRAILLTAALLPWTVLAQTSEDCPVERLVKVLIQPSAFPSLPGQAVTLRVFVEPVQGTAEPTGDVQLSDGAIDLGTLTLKQAQGVITRTFSESGAHVLRAAYSGDLTYCSVVGVFGMQVDHLTPAITLASSAASAGFGEPITLTAQIAATVPAGVAPPLGAVQFMEGSTVLGSAVPLSGAAKITLVNLAPGVHQIAAVLTGDPVWYQVRSMPLMQTIVRGSTIATLTASAGIASTILSANFPPATGGTVQFLDVVSNVVFGTVPLLAGGAPATVTLSAAQVLASAGHPIRAVYSGTANFEPNSSSPIGIPVAVNSAGAASPGIAPEEIVSLYGWSMTDSTVQAAAVPLPISLDGYRVTVTDSAGGARTAELYLVSPGQINFVVPKETAPGIALIALSVPGLRPPVVPIRVNVVPVAPGIFTTTSDGKGLPAAQLVRVRPDGSRVTENVTADGIRIGSDTVYLLLYGTGIRNRSSLAAVTCTIGDQDAPVSYAGPQPESPGLDQVNVLLQPSARRRNGEVALILTVDGQTANPVTLRIID